MGSGRTYPTTRILPLPEVGARRESPRLLRPGGLPDPAPPPLRRSRLRALPRCGPGALLPTTTSPGRALPNARAASSAESSAPRRRTASKPNPGVPFLPGCGKQPSFRATVSERLSGPLPPCAERLSGPLPPCAERLSGPWPPCAKRLSEPCPPCALPRASRPKSAGSPLADSSRDRARPRAFSCQRRTGRFSASLRVPLFSLFSPLEPPSPNGSRRGPDHTIPSLSRRVEPRPPCRP